MLIGYNLLTSRNVCEAHERLRAAGCEKIYTDVSQSNKAKKQPGLEQALAALRPGDVLVVSQLDQLGLTVWSLLRSLYTLSSQGAGFQSLEEGIKISSPSPETFYLLKILVSFEEQKLQLRSQVRQETIRKKGSKNGRPKSLQGDKLKLAYAMIESEQFTTSEICERLNVTRTTLYNSVSSAKEAGNSA